MDHWDHCEIEKEEKKKSPKSFNLGQYILRHLFIKFCIFKFILVHEAIFRRGKGCCRAVEWSIINHEPRVVRWLGTNLSSSQELISSESLFLCHLSWKQLLLWSFFTDEVQRDYNTQSHTAPKWLQRYINSGTRDSQSTFFSPNWLPQVKDKPQ